jgi:EAL domain-containing protein (putative c-di-GMP-specific phosphodiesterase class I)/CheY-like chemotaxis protein
MSSELKTLLEPVSTARVLVLDDNVAATTLVRQVLERAGLAGVTTLNDPREAAKTVEDLDPDLILLDLRMPGLDGFEVLRVLNREAAAMYRPIVILSADDSRESLERALQLGAHDFLRKPIDSTELVLRARNLLLHRQAYLELRRSRALLRSRLDVFEPDIPEVAGHEDEFRERLSEVIATENFQIAMQPLVDMRTGVQSGAEALARFTHCGMGGPASGLTIAAAIGMSTELEVALFKKAARLADHPKAGGRLAINMSPTTLVLPEAEGIFEGVDIERIVVELTEHTPVEDYGALRRMLDPLRKRGLRVAVDDTGAGFASLRHILDLRPDIIKLDTSLCRDVDKDPTRRAIAGMLVSFSADQGLTLIGEGVETEEERDTLLELGAVFGQGYLFARPEIIE